ncbi:MAG TPA: pseudouridine-5'-phosphate glycosidase, partial [Pyrinomonadaceae bacterium]|nr:pseudouridine-5'-phosphate glycosidase [Pyrinomonadaceae bacterium]
MKFNFNEEIAGALHFDRPRVALESTVISHGLPHPRNLDTALTLEQIVRDTGAIPATIAMFDGEIFVGLNRDQIEKLATSGDVRKLSVRDLAIASALKVDGATTVATTSLIAHRAGINVFATGGIGG